MVSLESKTLVMDGGSIDSTCWQSGSSGDVSISAVDMYLRDGTLAVNGKGSGSAGTLTLRASGKVNILDGSYLTSGTSGSGPGGLIHIVAPDVLIQDSIVESGTYGSGKGGDISVECSHLTLASGSILSGAGSTGDGGTVSILADSDILIKNIGDSFFHDARISTNAFNYKSTFNGDDGNAGSIFIASPVLILDDGILYSGALKGTGNAGPIKVNVNELTLANGGYIDASTSRDSTGRGGVIEINVRDSLLITGESPIVAGRQSHVSAGTSGTGNAGDIDIHAGSLLLTDNARIDVSSLGSGNAGAIRIKADSVVIARTNGISGIKSLAYGSGNGGDIQITSDRLDLIDGQIASSTLDEGNAGGVSLQVRALSLSDEGKIEAASNGSGGAGTIRIMADTILINSSSRNEYSSVISSDTAENGKGGDIWVTANKIDLTSDDTKVPSVIMANSTGSGRAGSITLDVKDALRLTNSGILTDAESSAGGNINLNIGHMLQMQGGKISSSANGVTSSDNGGNLAVTKPQFTILNTSETTARANAGNGGNISLGAGYFVKSSDSTISASSKQGLDGKVVIDSPNQVAGTLSVLPLPPLNVSELLRERCAAAANRGRSSFTIQGPGGIAPRPGDFLASPFPRLKKSEADMISRSVR
jgi:large exoprotein involved in heme utilization and adhesion